MHTPHLTRAALLLLGIASLVCRSAAQPAPADWPGLQRHWEDAGLDAPRVREVVRQCRREGVGIEDAHLLMAGAMEAAREGLPAEPVMAKIMEGLGKGIPPADIAHVSQGRVRHLRRAREIVRASAEKLAVEGVIIASALALESGLSEEALRGVMMEGRDRSARDMAALLQAGEALCLAGFESDDVHPILTDCLQRRLSRVELRRMVRYAAQQRQRGVEPGRIRQALWGEAQGSAHQHRERNGQGPGAGPGHGGPRHGRGNP